MVLDEKPLNELTETDLQRLVQERVQELLVVEYKRELPSKVPGEKKEFLADVSSFANARGGYLIYGVEADGAEPIACPGISVEDYQAEVTRLEQMIRDGIEPRLFQNIHSVGLASGRYVFVIQVPRSWAAPHRVKFEEWSRFYSRSTTGKYNMDVQELRAAFTHWTRLTDSIREFKSNRLASILTGDAPVPVRDAPMIVLHVIPFSAFSTPVVLHPLQLREAFDADTRLSPIGGGSFNTGFCYEGFVCYGEDENYMLVFRNGIVEAATPLTRDASTWSYNSWYDRETVKWVRRTIAFLGQMGVGIPHAIAVSLLRAKEVKVVAADHREGHVDRPDVLSHVVTYEDANADLHTIMRPAIDMIWNAAGFAQSPSYSPEGEWVEEG